MQDLRRRVQAQVPKGLDAGCAPALSGHVFDYQHVVRELKAKAKALETARKLFMIADGTLTTKIQTRWDARAHNLTSCAGFGLGFVVFVTVRSDALKDAIFAGAQLRASRLLRPARKHWILSVVAKEFQAPLSLGANYVMPLSCRWYDTSAPGCSSPCTVLVHRTVLGQYICV